jgi:hypothetical protein
MRRFVLAGLFCVAVVAAASAQPKPAAPPAGAQNSSFNLVNRSGQQVRELFVTSAGNSNWGQNRLDGKGANPTAIAAGASYAVRRKLDTNCVFDIRAVFADGKAEERKGVNTCAVEDVAVGAAAASSVPVAATGKPADDPSFKLFNRSARPITELRASPSGGGAVTAAENRLGSTPLPPDNSRRITLPRDGNCIFEVRVVFADGTAKERHKFNLCKVADLPVP